MQKEVELAPFLGDVLEYPLRLALDHDVERHEDRRLQRLGKRIDVLFGLFVEIGDGDIGTERTKRLGAAPGDRLIVGNADNESLFAFQGDLGLGEYRDIHDILARSWLRDCRFMSRASVCWAIISSSSVGTT